MWTFIIMEILHVGVVPWDEGFAEISPIQEKFIDGNFTDSNCFKSAAFVEDVVVNNSKSMKSMSHRYRLNISARYCVTIFVISSADKTSVCILRAQQPAGYWRQG